MSLDLMQSACFVFVGLFFAAYTVLDGFDLGIGILFPFLGRTPMGKRTLLKALAPVWDGNEVWLLGGVTVLLAAFPAVYATVFSGFYLAVIVTVLALMMRAVTFEFWSTDEGRRRLWDIMFTAGSLVPPLLLGVALGNVIQGVPLAADGEYAGDFLTLFRPFPLMVGVFGVLVVAMQGAAYAAMKTSHELQLRARRIQRLLRFAFPVALAVLIILTYTYVPSGFSQPVAWVGIALALAAWASTFIPRVASDDRRTFLMSSLMVGALWLVAGSMQFPNLVFASNDAANSLTVYNASSPEGTLWLVIGVTAVGLPIVILYTFFVYRVFKGKIASIT